MTFTATDLEIPEFTGAITVLIMWLILRRQGSKLHCSLHLLLS